MPTDVDCVHIDRVHVDGSHIGYSEFCGLIDQKMSTRWAVRTFRIVAANQAVRDVRLQRCA